MNRLLKTALLSMLFITGVNAAAQTLQSDFLRQQTMAIMRREMIKKQLNDGKMIVSSAVINMGNGAYLLKGLGYLPDEIYVVTS